MGLMQDIQEDVRDILSDENDFALPVQFTSNTDPIVTVTCNALAFRHNLVVDESTGLMASGRNARVTVSELTLRALSYPVRNSDNAVDMMDHIISWTDVSSVVRQYTVREQYPDETTGLIGLQLGLFTS